VTQLPSLREALRDTARRRHRRRRALRLIGPFTLGAATAAVATVLVFMSADAPEREAIATPSPTPALHTVKVVPLPTPEPLTGPPMIVEARTVPNGDELYAQLGASKDRTVERAWWTPGMQGEDAHVFLYRKGDELCLAVPDPMSTLPGDHGVGCSSPKVFERYGVSVTVGSNYAAVVPDPKRRPLYRHADGTRERLKPILGLVALARAEAGSAVSLIAPDGQRRTDSFRGDRGGTFAPTKRHECSNGKSVTVPATYALEEDPCAATQP
jgi:hypothetical protein